MKEPTLDFDTVDDLRERVKLLEDLLQVLKNNSALYLNYDDNRWYLITYHGKLVENGLIVAEGVTIQQLVADYVARHP